MLRVSLIWELTRRDFLERYAGSVLGALWAVIWPLINLFIYIVIFGKMMGGRLSATSNVYAYSIYLAVGLIPWICFTQCISRASSVFIDKKHIITKVRISLLSLLIYINLAEMITFMISCTFLLFFLLLSGYRFTIHLLLVPFVFYLQQLLAFGLGLISAIFTVFIRDTKEVVGVILQLWFWFTPIVYVCDILPDFVKKLLIYNPGFIIIDAYHEMFVFHHYPEFSPLIVLTFLTHAIILGAYLTFRFLEKDIRDFL